MDDFEKKLNDLLSNPEQINELKNLASSLFNQDNKESGSDQDFNNTNGVGMLQNKEDINVLTKNDFNDIPAEMLLKATKLFKHNKPDNRINLLTALKPHLSPEKQKKVENAIKLLKLYSILPLLKESGILDNFLN